MFLETSCDLLIGYFNEANDDKITMERFEVKRISVQKHLNHIPSIAGGQNDFQRSTRLTQAFPTSEKYPREKLTLGDFSSSEEFRSKGIFFFPAQQWSQRAAASMVFPPVRYVMKLEHLKLFNQTVPPPAVRRASCRLWIPTRQKPAEIVASQLRMGEDERASSFCIFIPSVFLDILASMN